MHEDCPFERERRQIQLDIDESKAARKKLREEIEKLREDLHQELRAVRESQDRMATNFKKTFYEGNGNPSLLVRIDRLEQSRALLRFIISPLIGALMVAVGAGIVWAMTQAATGGG